MKPLQCLRRLEGESKKTLWRNHRMRKQEEDMCGFEKHAFKKIQSFHLGELISLWSKKADLFTDVKCCFLKRGNHSRRWPKSKKEKEKKKKKTKKQHIKIKLGKIATKLLYFLSYLRFSIPPRGLSAHHYSFSLLMFQRYDICRDSSTGLVDGVRLWKTLVWVFKCVLKGDMHGNLGCPLGLVYTCRRIR